MDNTIEIGRQAQVCHHEAGHAVSAVLLGCMLRDAATWREGADHWCGLVGWRVPEKAPAFVQEKLQLLAQLAGPMAEAIHDYGIGHVYRSARRGGIRWESLEGTRDHELATRAAASVAGHCGQSTQDVLDRAGRQLVCHLTTAKAAS